MDVVVFSQVGHVPCGVGNIDVGAMLHATTSHKFPTYSPAVATLFDFADVYNGSKLRIGGEVCYLLSPSLQLCNTAYFFQSM